LNFSRATSVFGNGDLHFRPCLMMAPGGEDHPRSGQNRIFHTEIAKITRFSGFKFQSCDLSLCDGDLNFRPRLMMALGREDRPRRGKTRYFTQRSQRSQRFSGFKFQSCDLSLCDGDLNFRPRLMMALGRGDRPRRGKTRYFTQRSQRSQGFSSFEFQSSTSFGDGGQLRVRSLSRRPIFFARA
jgi:hypothetical protein